MTKSSLIEKEFAKHDIAAPPKTNKRTSKKIKKTTKKVENMVAPKTAPRGGLKEVKNMLEDRIAIDAMQDMLNKPKQSIKKETPKQKQVAQPTNPFSAMLSNPNIAANMDPNQLMQMLMMSNPNTAMLWLLMQSGMGKGQKTTEDVGNLKDLAEIISVLKDGGGGGQKDEFTKMMMIELLKQNRNPQPQNNQMMDMMNMFRAEMQETVKFWQTRALQAEQNANVDPISSLLNSREKLTTLQSVFGGGTPEDAEMRRKQFEAQLLMQKRQWDLEDKSLERQDSSQRSAQQFDLLSKGLAAMTEYVVKPTMGAIKDGIINNPNAFEKIRNPEAAMPTREDLVPNKEATLPEMRENKLPSEPPEPINPFLAPMPTFTNPQISTPPSEPPIENTISPEPMKFTEDHIIPRPTAKKSVQLP